MPEWLVWLKYLSWFMYGNEALVINQWDGVEDIACKNINENITDICPMPNGEMVLKTLGFEKVRFE